MLASAGALRLYQCGSVWPSLVQLSRRVALLFATALEPSGTSGRRLLAVGLVDPRRTIVGFGLPGSVGRVSGWVTATDAGLLVSPARWGVGLGAEFAEMSVPAGGVGEEPVEVFDAM